MWYRESGVTSPDFWQQMYARRERAEKLLSRIELIPVVHYSSQEFKGHLLKSYNVCLNGEVLGQVLQVVEHIYKKAGRLRYGDKRVLRWQYQWPIMESGTLSLYYLTRKEAAIELLDAALKKGLKPG